MSPESYRILDYVEAQKYEEYEWFSKEAINLPDGTHWLIPERRLTIDRKNFFRDKLQELLDDFDFERVHKVMEVLDWHWVGVNGIPKEEDMIPIVKILYDDIEDRVIHGEYSFCATGGFKLTFNPNEDNELSLVFEAETNSVYGD